MAKKFFNYGCIGIIVIFIIDFLNLPSLILFWLKLMPFSMLKIFDSNNWANQGLLIDILNWIDISNINWALFNILVIIFLYLLTFKNIESRTIAKETNKKEIAILLLNECYKDCEKQTEQLISDVKKFKIENTSLIQSIPFDNENLIFELVTDGQLSPKHLKQYTKVKKDYQRYVAATNLLFKIKEGDKDDEKKVQDHLKKHEAAFKKSIKEAKEA
ncbi:hypothetical protein AAU23_03195 [Listeria monocytogenes]|nr:hypothetical protein [Listeria monocytogenes]